MPPGSTTNMLASLRAAAAEARGRVQFCQRRALELMFHRALLERAGCGTAASDDRMKVLTEEMANFRAEQEFAEQRLLFREQGARSSTSANGGD